MPDDAVLGPTIAVALGAGGARGLAHIPVLEALDELGLRPVALAGTSMGALVGAAYAAGIPAKTLRRHTLSVLRDRSRAMAKVLEARVGRFADVFSGLGNPLLVDGELILDAFWPEGIPTTFEALAIPFQAVATDYAAREEAPFATGSLRPVVAGSIAIPGLIRPVRLGERLLIDGGASNPLPFDHLIGRADLVVAVDVAGGPAAKPGRMPSNFEITMGTIQIMQTAINAAKLKIYRPQVVLTPDVSRFRALDFLEARAIFAAAEPAKEAFKRELERHLGGTSLPSPGWERGRG
ncbi:patatin-like phospholipase family protein [Salinarimonas soli]|uniref:Patatin-like phospholipase family protein n=1 Tax=Salinarimonas soli TaxID=1638099 RepID=A0A5B2VB19_9HYPH|nr:patatin-like phospholipase family protein [Salinarimonas soli]KAA2236221.1 patatin-like phospholipase family protein [Salinarimonas soli]